MTPEQNAIRIANARLHVKADCDAGVNTDASTEALRTVISDSLMESARWVWVTDFAFDLFPEGQTADPSHLDLVEQLEELIAKDVMSLPSAEREKCFQDLDDLVSMLKI